jgi:hypothetical protein
MSSADVEEVDRLGVVGIQLFRLPLGVTLVETRTGRWRGTIAEGMNRVCRPALSRLVGDDVPVLGG